MEPGLQRRIQRYGWDKAVRYYEQALTFECDDRSAIAQTHLNLALLLIEKKPVDAIVHLKESLRLSPEQPQREAIQENIEYLEALLRSK